MDEQVVPMDEIADLIAKSHDVPGPSAGIVKASRTQLETQIRAAGAPGIDVTGEAESVDIERTAPLLDVHDLGLRSPDRTATRRRPAYAFAAAAALFAVILGVAMVLADGSRRSTSVTVTAESTNVSAEPGSQVQDTGANVEPSAAPTPLEAFLFKCGGTTIEVGPLNGYSGPFEGPGPDTLTLTPPADEVIHWIGSPGSIEFQWSTTRVVPEDGIAVQLVDDSSITSPKILHTEATGVKGKTCMALTSVAGNTEEDVRRGLGLIEDLRLPLTYSVQAGIKSPLVVGQQAVGSRPPVGSCEDPVYANHFGKIDPRTATLHSTPVDALRSFLDEQQKNSPDVNFSSGGFVELHAPDGTVYFGYTGLDVTDPSQGYPQLLTTTNNGDGWAVTEWETAGC